MTCRSFLAAAGLAVAVCALAPTPALADPKPETELTLPHDASVDGKYIDNLIYEGAAIEGPLFVAVCIWLLLAAVLWNRKNTASYDHGSWKHKGAVWVSIIGFLALAFDDALSWADSLESTNEHLQNYEKSESAPDAVRIEVNAHQWAWNARYPGPDGKFNTADDIITLNDVRVPIGSPVIVELAAVDVIHDFYVPNFRVKQDAMPGMINRLMFTAKETGEFDIGCAMHCGVNHYKMKGLLTVLPKDEFAQWQKNASFNTSRLYDPDDRIAHWGWDWTWKKGQ